MQEAGGTPAMAMQPLTYALPDAAATEALGAGLGVAMRELAQAIARQGFTVHLQGDLGAGKTTLVRALLRELGVQGAVKSPTYTLLEPYEVSRLHLYHFDFYRFKNPREFTDGGFAELFGPGGVCLVEWPERASGYLPPADLQVLLTVLDAGRDATLLANTEIGATCLQILQTTLQLPAAGA
jgi:tRNA threonylcarbamoyladenosine biosynthesis protein TsaE